MPTRRTTAAASVRPNVQMPSTMRRPSAMRGRAPAVAPRPVPTFKEEEAAFGKASKATEALRSKLPRPRDTFRAVQDGNLSEILRARDDEEQRKVEAKRRQAEEEYAAFLEERRGRKGKGVVFDDDGDDDEEEEDDQETGSAEEEEDVEENGDIDDEDEDDDSGDDDGGARFADPVAPAPLMERAKAAAETIRTAAPAATAASAPATSIVARLIVDDDIDRLWDWIRAEPDRDSAFFGGRMATARQLYTFVTQLAQLEMSYRALARSLYYGDVHFGLVALTPIFHADRFALVHLYLEPKSRGTLPQLLPYLLQQASTVVPGYRLGVLGDPSWGKLLSKFGFDPTTMFIQRKG